MHSSDFYITHTCDSFTNQQMAAISSVSFTPTCLARKTLTEKWAKYKKKLPAWGVLDSTLLKHNCQNYHCGNEVIQIYIWLLYRISINLFFLMEIQSLWSNHNHKFVIRFNFVSTPSHPGPNGEVPILSWYLGYGLCLLGHRTDYVYTPTPTILPCQNPDPRPVRRWL